MSSTEVQVASEAEQISQLREFLFSYNRLSEKCFRDCVHDFTVREVRDKENKQSLHAQKLGATHRQDIHIIVTVMETHFHRLVKLRNPEKDENEIQDKPMFRKAVVDRCASNCLQKFLKMNQRLSQRFQEFQLLANENAIAAAKKMI